MSDDGFRLRSILVVDDSAVQRLHLVARCRELGIAEVHEAADGAEALALIDRLEQWPEALVTDLEMPVMDGIELIQQLLIRHIDIPCVVVSARESVLVSAVLEMARAQGRFIERTHTKNLSADELRTALLRCARQRKASPPQRGAGDALVTAAQIESAIAGGLIRPHFQPKVDVRTGLLRGVEALARWHDERLGHIPPDRFIPVAEANGLIHGLTMSMLRQSAEQAAQWRARGFSPTVAVNLAPQLLDSADLVREIQAIVLGSGLRPEDLVLEITESAVVSHATMPIGNLARLRMLGYGLAIDDYGTGYSSMQQLARVPFTELKIDRSFVNGAHANESLRVMLRSAIEMATRLKLTTVAEGVESAEDWQLLRQANCEVAQGWFIGKALPGAELADWLRQHTLRLADLRRADASARPGGAP